MTLLVVLSLRMVSQWPVIAVVSKRFHNDKLLRPLRTRFHNDQLIPSFRKRFHNDQLLPPFGNRFHTDQLMPSLPNGFTATTYCRRFETVLQRPHVSERFHTDQVFRNCCTSTTRFETVSQRPGAAKQFSQRPEVVVRSGGQTPRAAAVRHALSTSIAVSYTHLTLPTNREV